jgi:hypothetical protein
MWEISLTYYMNITPMDTQKWIWLIAKGLSFASIGAIIYVLFCIQGH